MRSPLFFIVVAAVAIIILTVVFIISLVIVSRKQRALKTKSFTRTKRGFSLKDLFARAINDAFFAELEARLLAADTGFDLTKSLVTELRARIDAKKITDPVAAKEELRAILTDVFVDGKLSFDSKTLLFVVGVNGVGKTTTISKLANALKFEHSVLLVAADTFRAAAIEQLETWATRLNVPIVKGQQDGDPASVLFDALSKAEKSNVDLVIADTAGRFHNKEHLVRQLVKMKRIAIEKFPAYRFVPILVLDTNVGQNGLEQAKVFLDDLAVEGVVLAKFDATGKGGVAFAINKYLALPILYVGVGEQPDQLEAFDKQKFIASILDE